MPSGVFAQETKDPKKEEKKESRNWWAIDVGAYFPTDGEIRDRFGNTLWRAGFRPYRTPQAERGKVIFDATIISARNDEDRMLVIPLTVGVLKTFGEEERGLTFVSAGIGPAFYDYSIHRTVGLSLVDHQASTFGVGAHVDVGLTIQQRLTFTARYDWFSKSDDFDFSGFSINLSFAAFRW